MCTISEDGDGFEIKQMLFFQVEKIVGHRQSAGQTVYRIRWKGWAAKDDTWQAEDDLSCGAILKKYKSEMTAASASPKKEGRGRPAKPAASTPTKKRKSVGSRGVAHGKVTKTGRPRKTEASKGRKSLSLKPKKKVGRKPKQDKEWEVEEVVAVRTTEKGKEEFYIKWKGYSSDENTWEPAANVANCNRAVERFRMTQGDEEDEGTSALPSDGDAEEPKTNGTTKEKDTDADDDDEENGKEQNKSSSLTADGE